MTEPLTISGFQTLADSPLEGFARLNNIEIFEKEGVAKIQYGAHLSFTTGSLPMKMVYDSAGNQYVGCRGGEFYVNGVLNATATNGICDMELIQTGYNEYILTGVTGITITPALGSIYTSGFSQYKVVATAISGGSGTVTIVGTIIAPASGTMTKVSGTGDASFTYTGESLLEYNIEYVMATEQQSYIGFYGPTYSGSASFVESGSALSDTCHRAIWKSTDVNNSNIRRLYIGNAVTVAMMDTVIPSAIGVAPTYNLNSGALTIEQGYSVYSLSQTGKYLAVGCILYGANIYDNVNLKGSAFITWDRTSTTFNNIVYFKENGITQLMQLQNRLFMGIGNRGRVHLTDGVTFNQIKRIPFSWNRQFGNYAFLYPNAMTLHNGEMLVGVSGNGNGNAENNYGVYCMSLKDMAQGDFPLLMRNSPSTGGTGVSQTLNIGFVHSSSADVLFIGWQDGASYGVDAVTLNVVTGNNAEIYSQFYTVGSQLLKKTYKRMEISLTQPLTGDQQITVAYRENINGTSWTPLGTYTATNFGPNNNFNTLANLASKTKLQFKITLNQSDADSALGNNIELISLSFIPSEE